MAIKELMELEKISQAVGNSPDLVQGGGGNTSAKLDANLMAVKASGYQLKQITTSQGYVVVDYQKIIDYYRNVNLLSQTDYEKDAIRFLNDNIVCTDAVNTARPSVEAGFHAILKKYVIHTHSVYANILCCSKEGEGLVRKIFTGKPYACLWIPYVNPGFALTLKIKNALDDFFRKEGASPDVIFMENHGLIVHADDCDRCVELDRDVNRSIREWFSIDGDYPEIVLQTQENGLVKSETPYLAEAFREGNLTEEFFENTVLYPDQLVYLNNSLPGRDESGKSGVKLDLGGIAYNTSFKEAQTIEETLLGYLYVIHKINEKGLTLKTMPTEGIRFIKNWESEKYRKSIANGK